MSTDRRRKAGIHGNEVSVYVLRPLQGRAGPFRNAASQHAWEGGARLSAVPTVTRLANRSTRATPWPAWRICPSPPSCLSEAQGAAGKPFGEGLLGQLRKPVSLLPVFGSGAVTLSLQLCGFPETRPRSHPALQTQRPSTRLRTKLAVHFS